MAIFCVFRWGILADGGCGQASGRRPPVHIVAGKMLGPPIEPQIFGLDDRGSPAPAELFLETIGAL